MSVLVVVYAAKSTEDSRGSIPAQLADCREAVEREGGREVITEFTDEAVSAFKRSRGPGLAGALEAAERAAEDRGTAELWVQHTDRLARGDGRKGGARHLGGLFFDCRELGIRLRSVQDDGNLEDAIRAVLIGERNFEDSARKSATTRSGLQRRKDAGRPVGAVPLGYVAVRLAPEDDHKTRVIDEAGAATVRRIFADIAGGRTPGEVVRSLNAEGLTTKRGGGFNTRRLRELARTRAYVGEGGYPQIIDEELFAAATAALDRRSLPAGQRQGLGGREPRGRFMLRGIARCGVCGETLYTRDQGRRVYVCGNRRRANGLCAAAPIRADVLEGAVFSLLEKFIGGLGGWVDQRIEARQKTLEGLETVAERERGQLATLQRRLGRAERAYDAALDSGEDAAAVALEQVARVRGDLERQAATVADVEARAAEWSTDVDADALKRWLDELFAAVNGRLHRADSVDDLAAALRSSVARLDAHTFDDEEQGHRLQVEMTTRVGDQAQARRHRLRQPAEWAYLDGQEERLLRVLGRAIPDDRPSCTTTPLSPRSPRS